MEVNYELTDNPASVTEANWIHYIVSPAPGSASGTVCSEVKFSLELLYIQERTLPIWP